MGRHQDTIGGGVDVGLRIHEAEGALEGDFPAAWHTTTVTTRWARWPEEYLDPSFTVPASRAPLSHPTPDPRVPSLFHRGPRRQPRRLPTVSVVTRDGAAARPAAPRRPARADLPTALPEPVDGPRSHAPSRSSPFGLSRWSGRIRPGLGRGRSQPWRTTRSTSSSSSPFFGVLQYSAGGEIGSCWAEPSSVQLVEDADRPNQPPRRCRCRTPWPGWPLARPRRRRRAGQPARSCSSARSARPWGSSSSGRRVGAVGHLHGR